MADLRTFWTKYFTAKWQKIELLNCFSWHRMLHQI